MKKTIIIHDNVKLEYIKHQKSFKISIQENEILIRLEDFIYKLDIPIHDLEKIISINKINNPINANCLDNNRGTKTGCQKLCRHVQKYDYLILSYR